MLTEISSAVATHLLFWILGVMSGVKIPLIITRWRKLKHYRNLFAAKG